MPSMAYVVMVLLIIALIIYVVNSRKKQKAIVVSLGIWMMYIVYLQFRCGANPLDTRVMKPMLKTISGYIVKNGIPKSLEDIPNMPYELSGCKRNEHYKDSNGYDCNSSDKAKWHKIEEECYFEKIKLEFWISDDLENSKIDGEIKMISDSQTVMSEGFSTRDGKTFELDKIDTGSYKNSGICNSLRQ